MVHLLALGSVPMKPLTINHLVPRRVAVAVAFLGVAAAGTAAAQHAASGSHWTGGGGYAAPGGAGHGAYSGGYGWHGYPGYGYPGYGYGWRGYGYGWRYGWGGGCCWGWGWPLGVYASVLPWYYSTVWWQGVPYYYVDNNYYLWDGSAGSYEQVQPPSAVSEQVAADSVGSSEVFAYPKNGQSAQQQATDKSECRTWAAGQTGFDPATANVAAAKRQDFLRAQVACLEGRGYSAR
jgi:hypothetical protein